VNGDKIYHVVLESRKVEKRCSIVSSKTFVKCCSKLYGSQSVEYKFAIKHGLIVMWFFMCRGAPIGFVLV